MQDINSKVVFKTSKQDIKCLECKIQTEEERIKKELDKIVKQKFFQKKVKSLANSRGISLTRLAELLGYKRATLYKKLQGGLDSWVESKEDKPKLQLLLDFLGCKQEDLKYKDRE